MFVLSWLNIQFKILNNSFKKNRREFLCGDIMHPLIVLFGLVLIYIFLTTMFRFVAQKSLPALDFAFFFLSFTLLMFLPLIFYSAVVMTLSFLFQKEEVYFYFSFPVNRLSIFSVKFIQVYFYTCWMVFLGFMTFIAALQNYFNIGLATYLTAGIGFAVFLLIPVSLAAITVIVISCFVSFVRARGVLTVIGLLTGSILVVLIRLMQPEQVVTGEGKMRLLNFVQNLHKPWMTIFPSEWLTGMIVAQTRGDTKGIVANFSGLFILAMALLVSLYLLANLFYKRIWEDAAVMSAVVNKKFSWQALLNIFPRSLRGFIRKDLLTFYRDIVEKGSLLIFIPLSFIYFYSVYQIDAGARKAGADPIFSFLYIYLFNFFYSSVVVAALSGRWVFPSVSVEANNFKLIKNSLIPLGDFLKAKFLLGFIPLFLLGEVLTVVSCLILRIKFIFILVCAVTTGLLCWGVVLIALSWGMRQADFSIQTPLDFALSAKGFLCLIRELIFVTIVIVLVGVPANYFLTDGFSRAFTLSLAVSVTAVFVILSILRGNYKSSLSELSRREI